MDEHNHVNMELAIQSFF